MGHPLTPGELQSWSKAILQEWSPALETDDPSVRNLFTKTFCDELRSFLGNAHLTSFSRPLVKATRIHLALEKIAELGGGWPEGFVDKAEQALEKIKKDTGGVEGLAGGLWDEGGSLEGCQEVVSADGRRRGYLIEMPAGQTGVSKAYETGDMGFRVGSWWLNTAAALRAGIISSIENFVTADRQLAYAVIMNGDHERPGATANEFILHMTVGALRLKLMASYRNRKPIRILRSHTLKSSLAPMAGVRYDGLHTMKKYSVKLNELPGGHDQWEFTVTLERMDDQPELAQALRHPTPDELVEWDHYQLEKEKMVKVFPETDGVNNPGIVLDWLPIME